MSGINQLLEHAISLGASDLHVGSFDHYYVRLYGHLVRLDENNIPENLKCPDKSDFLLELLSESQKEILLKNQTIDFAYTLHDERRVRVNMYYQNRGGIDGVFRIVDKEIPTLSGLQLPSSVDQMTQLHQGLILVTGAHGSGKTTTLSAMINEINRNRMGHVITIEDPIEFIHPNRGCIVTQREIGTHTLGFAESLRSALREDPDIIVVGEMRDLDTIAMALTCAETGHLVLGTLNTYNAASTIDRIIDAFPATSQEQVRGMVSDSLRGIISQQLIPSVHEQSRILALEILVGSSTLSNMIREKKTYNLQSYIQTGQSKYGMQTMDACIGELLNKKQIDWDAAMRYCHDPVNFLENGL